MRRYQLVEIEDQAWCPAVIRDGLTDYLQFVSDRTEPYATAAPLIADAVRSSESGSTSGRSEVNGNGVVPIVDLGSGAGGPWKRLVSRISAEGIEVLVCLTDLHPNIAAFRELERESNGRVRGDVRSIPADRVPADLIGFRTIFTAFHHLSPDVARRVLADAVANGSGIAVFEATPREWNVLFIMLLVPLMVWLSTPFIRPFRWSRLFLTYVIPAIPLVALFDGIVSALRTYDRGELAALAHESDPTGQFTWEIGLAGRAPVSMVYMIGTPKQ